jgi:hypothetical protein
MKPILLLLLSAIIFTAAVRADEQLISTFSWKELADSRKLTAGKLTGAPDNALEVDNRGPSGMRATAYGSTFTFNPAWFATYRSASPSGMLSSVTVIRAAAITGKLGHQRRNTAIQRIDSGGRDSGRSGKLRFRLVFPILNLFAAGTSS